MKALQKKLEQCEKPELIAIIQQMLRQEPDLQWLLTTPFPTSGAQEISLDPEVYRQQILAVMAAGDQPPAQAPRSRTTTHRNQGYC